MNIKINTRTEKDLLGFKEILELLLWCTNFKSNREF
jgi:hypothetical protein